MKIYIASAYAGREVGRAVALSLIQAGHIVTSSWLNETHAIDDGGVGAASDHSDDAVEIHAQSDFDDIDIADVVLMLTGGYVQSHLPGVPAEWLHSGGRHVETGYAWGKGKPVHILGEPENVFGRAFATCHPTIEDFLTNPEGAI